MDIKSYAFGFMMGKKRGGGSGGTGGDNTVIDVESLPTENIDDSKIYRMTTERPILWLVAKIGSTDINMSVADFIAMYGGTLVIKVKGVFDTLPDVMEQANTETGYVPCYVLKSTGVAYASTDGSSANAIKLGELLGGMSDYGWVDSVENIETPDTPILYTVRGGTNINYGIPNSQTNKIIHEYDGEWANLSEIKGEVDELMAEIDELTAEIDTLNQTIADQETYANFAKYMECEQTELWSTGQKLFAANHILSGSMNASVKSMVIPSGITAIAFQAFNIFENLTCLYLPDTIVHFFGTALPTAIERINYAGTKEQWKAISFGDGWNNSTGNYTVYCSDGTIAKDGTET